MTSVVDVYVQTAKNTASLLAEALWGSWSQTGLKPRPWSSSYELLAVAESDGSCCTIVTRTRDGWRVN